MTIDYHKKVFAGYALAIKCMSCEYAHDAMGLKQCIKPLHLFEGALRQLESCDKGSSLSSLFFRIVDEAFDQEREIYMGLCDWTTGKDGCEERRAELGLKWCIWRRWHRVFAHSLMDETSDSFIAKVANAFYTFSAAREYWFNVGDYTRYKAVLEVVLLLEKVKFWCEFGQLARAMEIFNKIDFSCALSAMPPATNLQGSVRVSDLIKACLGVIPHITQFR